MSDYVDHHYDVKTPVSHWQRNEWIAAFILALALLVVRLAVYTLAKYEDPSKKAVVPAVTAGGIPTHHIHHHHHHDDGAVEPLSSYATMGVPASSSSTLNIAGPPPVMTTTTPASFKFSREGLQNCSNILLVGFILLLANAAFSGTMGYVSRSTMALSWSLMAIFLIWGFLVLFVRNHLLPLIMVFWAIIFFIAYWSIIFHQTFGI